MPGARHAYAFALGMDLTLAPKIELEEPLNKFDFKYKSNVFVLEGTLEDSEAYIQAHNHWSN